MFDKLELVTFQNLPNSDFVVQRLLPTYTYEIQVFSMVPIPDKLLLHEVIFLDPLMTPATSKETITYKESVDSFKGSSHNKLTKRNSTIINCSANIFITTMAHNSKPNNRHQTCQQSTNQNVQ